MSFDGDFRALLLGDSSFSDAVGGRFYNLRLPQDPALPCAVFQIITDIPENDNDTVGDTLCTKRVQVDIYSADADPTSAAAARDALKAFANGASGIQGGTDFQEIAWDNATSLYEREPSLFRQSIDLMVASKPI